MPSTQASSGTSFVLSSVSDARGSESTPSFSRTLYEFADFRLDPANRQLCQGGKDVPLPGRAFDALLLLVQKPGSLITKEEMLNTVWRDSFVEEANLTVAISTLRRALNEDPHDRHYIQTVARRGYRFIAEVREIEPAVRTLPQPSGVQLATGQSQTPDASAQDTASSVSTRSLPWSLVLLLLIVVAVLAFGYWKLLLPSAPIRTLAVLPFTADASAQRASALAGNSDRLATEDGATQRPNEVVLLGMTDGLISRLGDELVVRPTSSVLRYSMGQHVDPVEAGREQEVDAVLTGTIATTTTHSTLNLQLIRVRSGKTLWQRSFHSGPNALAQLEQTSGQAVAGELQRLGAIASPPRPASPLQVTNDPAYQLYMRGRYFWNQRTVAGLQKATDSFRQSIAADPNYAPAYAGLADSYALLASFSFEPGSDANAAARSAALSAIQLDPTLAQPHASLGMIYFFTDWNLTAAESEFERAIQLNPNYATAHHWYALDLAAMGRFPQALYEIHRAHTLDPLSLIIGTNVGWVDYLSRDYPAATTALNKVLELDPNFVRARTRLGMVELATGDYHAAIANLTRAVALSGDHDPWVEGLLGDAEAHAGDRDAAIRLLTELRSRSATNYVPPISRGLVLIGLGRDADAVTALAQAVQDHSTSMVYARVDPSLDPVRSDPSFQLLLSHIKP